MFQTLEWWVYHCYFACCLSVCLLTYLVSPHFTKFSVHITTGHGSVLCFCAWCRVCGLLLYGPTLASTHFPFWWR